jgi:hypothetical protein
MAAETNTAALATALQLLRLLEPACWSDAMLEVLPAYLGCPVEAVSQAAKEALLTVVDHITGKAPTSGDLPPGDAIRVAELELAASLAGQRSLFQPRTAGQATSDVDDTACERDQVPARSASLPAGVPECGYCRGRPGRLLWCNGCQGIRYCSAACQRAHWRDHKGECKRVQRERKAAVYISC